MFQELIIHFNSPTQFTVCYMAMLGGELVIRNNTSDDDISSLTIDSILALCRAFTLDHRAK